MRILGSYIIVKPSGERFFYVDKKNQAQEYLYTIQKQFPGMKIITDSNKIPSYIWANPKDYGWSIEHIASIDLDKTEAKPGYSYDEFNDAIIAADDSGKGIIYNKESILKSINNIIQTRDIGQLFSWLNLAGGKGKLLNIVNNLSKSFNTDIPDEFYNLLDEASKDWNKIPENKYIKTTPWSSLSKDSKMLNKIAQFEKDAKMLNREANVEELKFWLKANTEVDSLISNRSWKKIEEKYNELMDEVRAALDEAHKTKNEEDKANLGDLSHHLAQLWSTYLSYSG